ncbi:MAG: hypothetical protein ACFFBQ_16000 [Promethearchaeota archaeon]
MTNDKIIVIITPIKATKRGTDLGSFLVSIWITLSLAPFDNKKFLTDDDQKSMIEVCKRKTNLYLSSDLADNFTRKNQKSTVKERKLSNLTQVSFLKS